MTFEVRPDAYDRFMGRYSSPLAPRVADFACIDAGQRVLDVGCGPGALTAELVRRLGPGAVTAIDPSRSFVQAVRTRYPGVGAHLGAAEDLPFDPVSSGRSTTRPGSRSERRRGSSTCQGRRTHAQELR